MNCKSSINPITNPNPVCRHTYTHDNILDESLLQGSILAPTLFNIHIDIPFGFGLNNKFQICAHNTCSSARSFASIVIVQNISQIVVHALKLWISKW
jgi:hypothetical protein